MESRRIIAKPEQASLDFDSRNTYTVRRSSRARHLRITARHDTGIEVVVPKRMSLKHVEPFIRQHQPWIDQQIARLGLDQPIILPDTIHLQMTGEHWQVNYETGHTEHYRLKQRGNTITITGPDKELEACRDKLRQWLRKQAKQELPVQLTELGQQTGLSYQRVSIRTQRTRWGSCSSAGNLNLNDRLILLPKDLADYVMVHELCHTRHLNHSARFWQLVQFHIPDYRQLEKQLKDSRQYLPNWL